MSWIAENLIWISLGLGLLVLLGAIATYVAASRLLQRAAEAPDETTDAPEEPVVRTEALVPGSIRSAQSRINQFSGTRDGTNDAPIVVVIGAANAHTADIVTAAAQGVPENLRNIDTGTAHSVARVTADGILLDFGSGLLERTDWDEAWNEALSALRRYRPDRPLDAIVLAVPFSALQQARATTDAELDRLGQKFSGVLDMAQASTGYQLPVTLVISDCDTTPSFAAISADAIRTGNGNRVVIGWSTPGNPAAELEPAAIADATSAIADRLETYAVDALGRMTQETARNSTDMLTASQTLRRVQGPLTTLVAPILRRTAHNDPMFLRGIYLTGSAADTKPAPFVQSLFSGKIFAESGLAQPARGRITNQRRQRRRLHTTAGVLAGVGCLGLLVLATSDFETASVSTVLKTLEREQLRVETTLRSGQEIGIERARQHARKTYDAMSNVTVGSATSTLSPLSYVSSIRRDVSDALRAALDTLILPAFETGLHDRFSRAIKMAEASKVSIETPFERFAREGLPIQDLEAFVDEITNVDSHTATLLDTESFESGAAFAETSEFSLGVKPAEAFFENYDLYRPALTSTSMDQTINRRFSIEFQDAFGPAGVSLFRGVFEASPLFQALLEINRIHSDLETGDVVMGRDLIQRTTTAIRTIEAALDDNDVNWLAPGEESFTPRLDALAERIANLSFLETRGADAYAETIAEERTFSQANAMKLTGFLGRSILVVDDVVRLDPLYPALADGLDVLMNSDLLEEFPDRSASLASNGRTLWVAGELETAAALLETVQTTVLTGLSGLPEDIRAVLASLVQQRTEARIANILIDAQRLPAANLSGSQRLNDAEMTSFASAGPLLATLRDQASLLGMDGIVERIDRTATAQARRLLTALDQSLANSGLYRARFDGLTLWDGEAGSAGQFFGYATTDALAAQLADWRSFLLIAGPARAEPLVTYLERALSAPERAALPAFQNWSRLIAVLSDYEAGVPDTTLSRLERFVLIDMNRGSDTLCDTLAQARRQSGDYFVARQAALAAQVASRCEELQTLQTADIVSAVSDEFDLILAGRYPFVGVGNGAPLTSLDIASDPVDAETVRYFFDANAELIDMLATAEAAPGVNTASARAFGQKLATVRSFLAVDGGNLREGGPAFAVGFEFRTNRALETGGNQIVAWDLTVGTTTLSGFDAPRDLIWRYGDPITLSMRWARSAPNMPTIPGRADQSLADRTVRYTYADPWALITFVTANTVTGPLQGSLPDPRANAVLFDIPLAVNPDAAAGAASLEGSATIYGRVSIRPLDASGAQATGSAMSLPVFPNTGATF